MHLATRHGCEDLVKVLLYARVSVIHKDEDEDDGSTPLHEAAYYGHVDIVRMLLAVGAKFHETNKKWRTALQPAINTSYTEIATLLIAAEDLVKAAAAKRSKEKQQRNRASKDLVSDWLSWLAFIC